MASFSYRVVTKENKVIVGSLVAPSHKKALVAIAKEHQESTVLFAIPDKTRDAYRGFLNISFGFSASDRIFFFRNLAAMLSAGLALTDAFRVLEEQTQHKPTAKKVFAKIRENIENGQKLSSAMKRFPRYFSGFLCESVAVGETTGRLIDTLEVIADDLEQEHELKRLVRAQMAYPAVVVVVMIGVMTVLMMYVLPQIAELFYELEVPLPLLTRILLGVSYVLKTYPWAVALVLGVIIGSIVLALRKEKSRYVVHYLMLKLPLFGEIMKQTNLALYFRALHSLFASGISLVRSVEIAKETLRNAVFRHALDAAQPILLHGAPLSDTLKPYPFLFPIQAHY